MKLRKLKSEDAVYMLEWMHNPSVVEYMQADFSHKTLEDCWDFINKSQDTINNLHLAIVDDNDNYMGTVSLKNIRNDIAEFAIVVRKNAMGKGYSKYGMKEIVRLGLEELGLKKIYWCVSPENIRACKFYDKNGYKQMQLSKDEINYLTSWGGTIQNKSFITGGIKLQTGSFCLFKSPDFKGGCVA